MMKCLIMLGLVSVLPAVTLGDSQVFQCCPATGSGWTDTAKERHRLQNRVESPAAANFDPAINLARLLQPGRDSGRWFNRQAVEVTGYVAAVEPAPPSAANCNRSHPSMLDTRIFLALDDRPANARAERCLVAVVTPRWRARLDAQGIDWSLPTLQEALLGQWVRLQGWLYYDVDGESGSGNGVPTRVRDWRATAWEVHPVTSVEVVPPPASQVAAAAPSEPLPVDLPELPPLP
ncbi:hypothetical protein HQ590_09190 [bacterium]|nr:hypothetical protein [bacterium]